MGLRWSSNSNESENAGLVSEQEEGILGNDRVVNIIINISFCNDSFHSILNGPIGCVGCCENAPHYEPFSHATVAYSPEDSTPPEGASIITTEQGTIINVNNENSTSTPETTPRNERITVPPTSLSLTINNNCNNNNSNTTCECNNSSTNPETTPNAANSQHKCVV